MKDYSIYIGSKAVAAALRAALRLAGIRYYSSECGEGLYFSITCSPAQCDFINTRLDAIYNALEA